ncbi:serine hydrolase domain-containing protein [Streptomyces zagrosensis]|uniref:D-alanyl-D-alanine carboxypeptidase n=1 Tax=Streptomyces zagrosensis TaxID=1042984 RepID=A0A7W9UXH6_9ACTN|nr:serine hydrolase domain-containing protein [Streptomyces zagrosensis]MBB5934923.1 D-alanyl-D-alanine carboxypeptidase [Streptomyces zagrosensis]
MSAQAIRTAVVGATVVATLGAAALTAPTAGATDGADGASRDTGHAATQAAMDAQVADGVPGVVGQARDKHGVWNGNAGVADLTTGKPRGKNDRFRAGSINKTFTATVLLQLQAEGKIDLDTSVDTYLPGLVRGNGHDGRKITVRQLLNHTSGIFSYTADSTFQQKYATKKFLAHRYDTLSPQQAVALAMRHLPDFPAGTDWNYSNTNYMLAGLIIEKVTGKPYAAEVQRRIVQPLKLRSTTFPGTNPNVPAPSGRAYGKFQGDPQGKVYDVTRLNPSWGWAAGEIISNSADLNRFYAALLRGKLLPRAELAEMKTTVSTGAGSPLRYGLGLAQLRLSCDKAVWGHDGGIHGSASFAFASEDANHAIAFNLNSDWVGDGVAVVEAEFCGPTDTTPDKGHDKAHPKGDDQARRTDVTSPISASVSAAG